MLMFEITQHHISAESMFGTHVKLDKLPQLLSHVLIRFARTYTLFYKLFDAKAFILKPLQKLKGAKSCFFGSTSIRAPEKLSRVHQNSKQIFLHSRQHLSCMQIVGMSVQCLETLYDFKT